MANYETDVEGYHEGCGANPPWYIADHGWHFQPHEITELQESIAQNKKGAVIAKRQLSRLVAGNTSGQSR